jgi:hypothetical protein
LLESGVGTVDDIVGCSIDEIAAVQKASAIDLPSDYVAFLQFMGRRAGRLLRGEALYYPECLGAAEAAQDIASEPGEDLTPENKFFFSHHQGTMVRFFEDDSSAIFTYTERHPGEVKRIFESFLEWIWAAYERRLEWESGLLASHEERQRKREAMGLSREEFVPPWLQYRPV